MDIQPDPVDAYVEFDIEKGRKVCLVVGGSLGARTLNRSFMEGLNKLDRDDLVLLWQCGTIYQKEVEERVSTSGLKNIRVLPFISRMDLAYGVADVIISRAGAITISELCLAGKPVILVPSPNVAEDHQTHNAESLASAGAALMIPDTEATGKLVDRMLELMEDREEKEKLSGNIKTLGIADAAERIATEVYKILLNNDLDKS
jgi:UDP-N-acetylglucosamine--N-acetylmuramyl-(pentapeptide) pyrophosphoryl-undecaprenol N-acetylglucosamine transferase